MLVDLFLNVRAWLFEQWWYVALTGIALAIAALALIQFVRQK